MSDKMNQEIKKQWVKALRSRKYKQGHGSLCEVSSGEERFCCLGVLFDIAGGEVGGNWQKIENLYHTRWIANVAGEANSGFLPNQFRKFVGISTKKQNRIVEMNDTHDKSFEEIADWIEKYL